MLAGSPARATMAGDMSSKQESCAAGEQQQEQMLQPLADHLSPVQPAPALERESSLSRVPKKGLSAKFKEGLPTLLAPDSGLDAVAEGREEPHGLGHHVSEPGAGGTERSRRREREAQAALAAQATQAAQAAQLKSQSKSGTGPGPVHNCRTLFNKIHGHPRLGVAKLTQQVWSRSVWDLLKGGGQQQRVWCMGNPLQGGGIETSAGPVGRHTSQQPLALIEGMNITCISAGHFHSAAVAACSSEVYTWGTVVADAGTDPLCNTATAATPSYPASPAVSFSGCPSPAPQHEACPWQPFNAEPVSCMMVPELVPRPQTPGLQGLLARLPDSLRQGLKQTGLNMERQVRWGGTHRRVGGGSCSRAIKSDVYVLSIRQATCGVPDTDTSVRHAGRLATCSCCCFYCYGEAAENAGCCLVSSRPCRACVT